MIQFRKLKNVLVLLLVVLVFGGSCKKKNEEEIKPNSFNNDVQFLYNIIEKSDDTTKLEVYKVDQTLVTKPPFILLANRKSDSIKITSLLKSEISFSQDTPEQGVGNFIHFTEELNENTIVYVPDDYKEGDFLNSINGGNYFEYSQKHNKTIVFFGRSKTFFIPADKKSDENINNNFKIKIQLPKNISETFSPMRPFGIFFKYYGGQDQSVKNFFQTKIPRPEPTAFFNELYGAARKQRYPYRKSMVTLKPVSFDLPSIINDEGLANRQRIDGIYDIGRAVHHGSLFTFYVSNATDSLYESSLEKSKLMVTEVNKQNIPIGASKEYPFIANGIYDSRIECINDQYDLNIFLSGDAYKNTWKCNSTNLWHSAVSFRPIKAELKKTLKRYRIEFIYLREDGKEVRQHMYYQNTGYYYYYIKDEIITDENGLTFLFDDITEDLNDLYWEDKIDYNNTGYPRFWQFRGYDIEFPN